MLMRQSGASTDVVNPVYASLEDSSGMLDCLTMRAHLARWRGDEASATQADAVFTQLLADRETNIENV